MKTLLIFTVFILLICYCCKDNNYKIIIQANNCGDTIYKVAEYYGHYYDYEIEAIDSGWGDYVYSSGWLVKERNTFKTYIEAELKINKLIVTDQKRKNAKFKTIEEVYQ